MSSFNKLDDGSIVFLFGKHRNKNIQDIDDGYLTWMVKEHANKGSFDEDLIVEIEKELADRDIDVTELA